MFQVASEVVFVSPVAVRQTVSPLRSRASERAQETARESSKIVAFPVASKSPDDAWQSVGDAAYLVLRKLRPTPIASVQASSVIVASRVQK